MVIKPEHLEYMREAISNGTATDRMAHRARPMLSEYLAAGMSAQRWRWDLTYWLGLSAWLHEHVYSYANDNHIDTALRQITGTK